MSGSTDSETPDRTTQDRETRDDRVRTPEVPAPTAAPETQDRDGDRAPEGPAPEDPRPDGDDPDGDDPDGDDPDGDDPDGGDPHDDDSEYDEYDPQARRARWTAVATGVLLTVAGLAASVMRTSVSGTALIPLSYAAGALLCAGASALGAKGRTRRALWLMIVGVMVMAVGDQLD
ncbi:hypothetical protein [Streptomyces aureus]|uniref:hypothetical protein n=1 Tax=Streptomyces aureus TaxID=193461 RepID=UPI000B02740E|nr:hypothetical protein [Streptomyces aureus]